MYAQSIINTELLAKLRPAADAVKFMHYKNFVVWLNEFRTTSIYLPRQSGKTTALVSLMDDDTYLLTPKEHMRRYVLATTTAMSQNNEVRSHIVTASFFSDPSQPGMLVPPRPISCLFTDELDQTAHSVMCGIRDKLIWLNDRQLLAKDFFILNVGTPVC